MTTPFRYQLEDARALHRLGGRCLIASEMGLGKSMISLLFAQQHPEARPIIIICPASLKWNWQNECRKHFRWRAEVLEGKIPGRHAFVRNNQIVIINYDILNGWLDYLQELHAKLVIIDECGSFLGNQSTLRTRTVRKLCQGVPHVLALSGTPLVNRPAEMWPTLNILHPRQFPSFWPFGMAFCGPRRIPWGAGWDFRGSSNLDKLHQILFKDIAIRRRKADVLSQLPAKQRHVIPLEISDPKEYQHAHKDFVDWLAKVNPTKLSSALKAERLVRLGYLKRLAAQLKIPALLHWFDTFLRESEGKLVIGTLHQFMIRELRQKYRNLCVYVDGSVKGKDRQLAVDQFQNNRKTRIFLGQMKAAGTGLNLTAAHDSVAAEFDWSPGTHTQFEDRCYGRLSDLHGANAWWLVAHGTIETHLVKILQDKQETLTAVLDGGDGEELNTFDLLMQSLIEKREEL